MSNCVYIKICNKRSQYDNLYITNDSVIHCNKSVDKDTDTLSRISQDLATGDCSAIPSKIIIMKLDGIFTHYLIQELHLCSSFRKNFILASVKYTKNNVNCIKIKMHPPAKEIIDYRWNYRTNNMAWERLELDHALSWLSTLGGAFSALGDYMTKCATIAGKISFQQLQLALRFGDPTIAARCKLYLSLSLIQRGYLKQAKSIIYHEYHVAKNATVIDTRLIRMCLGIWSKLKYEYERKKRNR